MDVPEKAPRQCAGGCANLHLGAAVKFPARRTLRLGLAACALLALGGADGPLGFPAAPCSAVPRCRPRYRQCSRVMLRARIPAVKPAMEALIRCRELRTPSAAARRVQSMVILARCSTSA